MVRKGVGTTLCRLLDDLWHPLAPPPYRSVPQAADLDPADLSSLVQHYTGLEAANFKVFNECNAANEKIAAMQKRIRAVQVWMPHGWTRTSWPHL